ARRGRRVGARPRPSAARRRRPRGDRVAARPRADPAHRRAIPARAARRRRAAPPDAGRRVRPPHQARARTQLMPTAQVAETPAAQAAAPPAAGTPAPAPTALRLTLAAMSVLMARDLRRFFRQRSRVVGALVQPLIFWIVIGSGLAGSFRVPGAESVGYVQYF